MLFLDVRVDVALWLVYTNVIQSLSTTVRYVALKAPQEIKNALVDLSQFRPYTLDERTSEEEQYLIFWDNQNEDISMTCITNQCEIFNFLAKSRMF